MFKPNQMQIPLCEQSGAMLLVPVHMGLPAGRQAGREDKILVDLKI